MINEQKSAQTNEELFVHAYKTTFQKVATFIKKMGGTFEEAKDIFQDSLVIYYEKRIIPGRAVQDSESNYITGIAKHLWYKKYREDKPLRSLNILPELSLEEDEPKISENILRFVERSGKKCLELLQCFYYDKLSMKDIAERFGFSGERSATTQKYKCIEKIRDAVKERSLTKEDFYV
ncbi:RNA polymerase sigma factor [Aurantibacillus circumpalustris]|uniref:RNA polymerase sigma factor n=1 Tax=Aurantibacillus circumpalustris TaxID=3036359 RepID=UPI00295BEB24|nr:sigma-70 family RNA polymerase sigma factor [Aurantibacillus circumpalustris]